jgi:pyruvate phosphate dikinase (EC 2.7.9.1)
MSEKPEVYLFDEAAKLNLTKFELGGKGYGLVEMTKIGLPVPPGIVITTRMCNEYFKKGRQLWPELKEAIVEKVHKLEEKTGKKFNDDQNPLFSFRKVRRTLLYAWHDGHSAQPRYKRQGC